MHEFRITWGVSYGSVDEGEPVLHVDSHGQIALAVRGGRADEDFPVSVGDPVTVKAPGGGNRIKLEVVSG
jgi:S-adenosylmethionine hydrolase